MKPFHLDQKLDRIVQIQGKSYYFFSGTSYLGIGQRKEYEEVLLKNIQRWGSNHGLSRANNVRLSVFLEFEEFFANQAGAASGAVVSSGYLAGIAAWQWLYPNADQCWIAPDTHAAILPLNIKPDIQFNFTQWKKKCLELSDRLSSQRIFILGNAVDPLKAQIHEYNWIAEIAKKHEVTLLIDDSHAFGVLGESVFGTYKKHSSPSYNLMVSGSLGKGLGMPAGIILGNEKTIEGIKSQAIFIGASPGSPANLQTFLDTQDLHSAQFQKLKELCRLFFDETEELSTISGVPEFPAFIYQDETWTDRLENLGFITSSFSYPTAQSPKVNRIVISGFHEKEDVFSLLSVIKSLH
ncbi:7-keto-8-aminopelargonate synthetase-like enzyme [Algoriphagus boseongensis]|uniref:7-keto-8-aminopelargonate synthetase-like enzyme n=1 Tax=Algoriphagus boseongensis TaxID=1442587 RepID=A0A4R6T3U3_9BACT|nr:aminotransferase class I/II-fold pyridoxal phosphate-dependent enzyme [Algoriphagus boseongensis]TDQ17121.1 7-keto-8-aminopelargonate synthetase-like enzyme [Algoriphagus boseongensis]